MMTDDERAWWTAVVATAEADRDVAQKLATHVRDSWRAAIEERDAALRRAAGAERERDVASTRAAEWLAEKHLADIEHEEDIKIVTERAYRWAADWMRALAADQRRGGSMPTIGDWERLADRIEQGPPQRRGPQPATDDGATGGEG